MGVEVIHNQCYFFCIFVLSGDFFYKARPVQLSSSFRDLYHPLSCQWLAGKKNIGFAAAFVFIIVFDHPSWRCRDWDSRLRDQLFWRFVHAYNRAIWIKGSLIHIQHHFHIRDEATVLIWWNNPSPALPWLDFVFLKFDARIHEKCCQCN